jgi:hypothetical protein
MLPELVTFTLKIGVARPLLFTGCQVLLAGGRDSPEAMERGLAIVVEMDACVNGCF